MKMNKSHIKKFAHFWVMKKKARSPKSEKLHIKITPVMKLHHPKSLLTRFAHQKMLFYMVFPGR
jgi:hypothetical protein